MPSPAGSSQPATDRESQSADGDTEAHGELLDSAGQGVGAAHLLSGHVGEHDRVESAEADRTEGATANEHGCHEQKWRRGGEGGKQDKGGRDCGARSDEHRAELEPVQDWGGDRLHPYVAHEERDHAQACLEGVPPEGFLEKQGQKEGRGSDRHAEARATEVRHPEGGQREKPRSTRGCALRRRCRTAAMSNATPTAVVASAAGHVTPSVAASMPPTKLRVPAPLSKNPSQSRAGLSALFELGTVRNATRSATAPSGMLTMNIHRQDA